MLLLLWTDEIAGVNLTGVTKVIRELNSVEVESVYSDAGCDDDFGSVEIVSVEVIVGSDEEDEDFFVL